MTSITRTSALAVCAFQWVFLAPVVGSAQQVDDDEPYALGNLVLVGTKQDRDYVGTTASVGVLDSYRIEQQGISDLNETFDLIGNVQDSEGGSGNALFTIRGLSAEGVTESSNSAPLTSVVIDGTPQTIRTMRRGSRGLWDVDQVEVFRGPQSTLQGRGALAGAVVVQSKDPTFDAEWDSRMIFGQQNRREFAFALSGPIIEDQLAFRISAEDRYRKRGIKYNNPDTEIFGKDVYRSIRAKLLYEPHWAPGLSLKFTVNDVFDRPGQSVSNSADVFDREYNTAINSFVEARQADSYSAVFEAEYDFGNNIRLTSVSSYLDATTTVFTPPGNNYFRDTVRGDENFTQDFRLNFGSDETRFSGVLGLFFGRYEQPKPRDFITIGGIVAQDIEANDYTLHRSIYADVDWHFSDEFTLNVGGRLLYEKVSNQSISRPSFLNGFALRELNASTSDTVFLPQVGLTYHISDTQSLAASYRRGYRSGFNAFQGAIISKVKPEYLSSTEIAYRAEDPEGVWRFGATAFYSEYKDQQVVIGQPPAIPRTENAGRSKIYGAEFEGDYNFDNGVSVFGSLGLLRTAFTKFQNGPNNFSGNEFPNSPKLTASLGVSYEAPNGVFASIMASHSDDYFSVGTQGLQNDPRVRVPSFTRVDAQVGYRWNAAELVFYADNLMDNDYVTSISCAGNACESVVSEPRTIGFELRTRF